MIVHESHCHPYSPWIVCPGRADAVMRGAFWWDHSKKAYVISDIPCRTLSWRAVYFETSDAEGELYALEICPWCGMELPTLYADEQNLLQSGDQSDGNSD